MKKIGNFVELQNKSEGVRSSHENDQSMFVV